MLHNNGAQRPLPAADAAGPVVSEAEALLVIQGQLAHAFDNVMALAKSLQTRVHILQQRVVELEAATERRL